MTKILYKEILSFFGYSYYICMQINIFRKQTKKTLQFMRSRRSKGKLLRLLCDYGIITIAMLLGVVGLNLSCCPTKSLLVALLVWRLLSIG